MVTDFEGFKKSMVYPPVVMGLTLDIAAAHCLRWAV
jgi:hypothetical protein